MIEIDGAQGEGGGQSLRSSLSLSALTGQPFKITGIRANRPTPGLANQHLLAVRASAKMCGAKLSGDYLGSTALSFTPGKIVGGEHAFDCGTAGSTALVLQTLLPPALFAPEPVTLRITGGTENLWAPTSFYLREVFQPLAKKFGASFDVQLEKVGWYPEGGGALAVSITPCVGLTSIELVERGTLKGVSGYSVCSGVPFSVAERQKTRVIKQCVELGIDKAKITALGLPSIGKGSEVFIRAEYEVGLAGFTALGARGKAAEKVAGEAMHLFKEFHASSACVDEHASDQLVLLAALAKGKTRLHIPLVTKHLETNAAVIKQFLSGAEIVLNEEVEVAGVGFCALG
ncbi:RNA 3'-terminal-phosphate cyclase [Candidatus Micrarchaeota archaeon CG1_02_55_22]|nr:MAG: RNA 3'-terminal-phosphate cyclase [Candidatus Micrarchaeota archaeon CG1_02_55_22]